jgi:hypothetical protein
VLKIGKKSLMRRIQMGKRYRIKNDKFIETILLHDKLDLEYKEEPYPMFCKLILTPLERKILMTDKKLRLYIINEFTKKLTFEIEEQYIKDLLNLNLIEEYHITMEEFAEENCHKCKKFPNCNCEIRKKMDGNADCVYFEELIDEM